MILVSNPLSQYQSQRQEIDAAIQRVLKGGHYILGDEVEKFEKEFADYIGVQDAIGVASGTDALHLALWAAGVGEGDEVITVSHTAVATAVAIRLTGATPVFVDIASKSYNIDPTEVRKAITPRTKAIVAVHLYGLAVPLSQLREISDTHGLLLVEDCAQATGATYKGKKLGSIGDIAAFSFYPTKNLGAIGDGGMVVTKRQETAYQVRLLRQYGWAERYVSHVEGTSSRLDEIQAAILREKLKTLDDCKKKRNKLALQYSELLSGLPVVLPDFDRVENSHVFHLFVVSTPHRDELLQYLREKNIIAGVHYPVPIHLQPAYTGSKVRCVGELKNTCEAAKTVLSLPMYPELSEEEVASVGEAVRNFFQKRRAK